jgi:hypothetical protein
LRLSTDTLLSTLRTVYCRLHADHGRFHGGCNTFAVEVNEPNDRDSLSFRLSTQSLDSMIAWLRSLGCLGRFPEAYQALVLERGRRALQLPPQDIRLARRVFEALPPEVQSN